MPKNQDEQLIEPNKLIVFAQGYTLTFFDEINNATVAEALKILQCMTTTSPKKEIQIILNSPGGSVYDGLALYDYLISIRNPLTIICTGLCASMAIIILLAGQKRYITKNTRLMVHQISSRIEGKETDLKIDYDETKELGKICNKIVAERTGQSLKSIENEIKRGDKYLNAEQALKKGYIHKVI